MKYIVGIDEVGRGPLAGPVAVGFFVVPLDKQKEINKIFKDARDSKKLSPKKREVIFRKINETSKTHNIRYIVCYESNKVIDKKGISFAIKSCIKKAFKKLNLKPKETEVFLDGGLKAPKEFIFQKTIIKGDDKVLVISLASILAKVSRDALMVKISKKYKKYGLDVHKGYGTEFHRKAIKSYGFSYIHRITFCKNISIGIK